jgi:hypothetical protein
MMTTGSDIKVCQGDILSIKTIPKPYEDLNDLLSLSIWEKTQSN